MITIPIWLFILLCISAVIELIHIIIYIIFCIDAAIALHNREIPTHITYEEDDYEQA